MPWPAQLDRSLGAARFAVVRFYQDRVQVFTQRHFLTPHAIDEVVPRPEGLWSIHGQLSLVEDEHVASQGVGVAVGLVRCVVCQV